jgi:hypothetical protein
MTKSPLPETDSSDEQSATVETYDVGYRKPPVHTQFKAGDGRKRPGRPKGQRNVATVLAKALNERTKIREGNRTRTVTKLDAIVLKMINDAGMGNVKVQASLIALMRAVRLVEPADASPAQQAPLTLDDDALIADFVERNRERLGLLDSSETAASSTEIQKPTNGGN